MERKFKSHMVDVRGLSRKEAKEKRKDKCKRKVHTSRTYVKENINSI